ncbi:MAG: polyprenyl synthetase family protein [Dehalococcoides mccartyi]|uniref:polyprenyl synthetase family protein n=1 Tax=Dehalococcoides TaxID=61434 RepID=UPI002737D94E|nr:polyprenyl synthetase family protein [Dehalococcoides mccartyi]MDP4280190.1 polyprenyl synthetase family protein [Dehalococcoides mccartyi]
MFNKVIDLIGGDLPKVENSLKSVREMPDGHTSELLGYSLGIDGKRIRPALTLLSGKFFTNDLPDLIPMAASVELLHNATLIHDDVIDKSTVRHGRPTVNDIWGENKAIILGDYLFAKAAELCASTGNIRAIQLFSHTLAMMSIGEMNQAFDAFNLKQTREQYLDRICKKTASLFILATESGAILSKAPEQSIKILREYGYNLGMAFQIVDDLLDFLSTEDELGKPVGSDLAQGTLTLPAILILERQSEDGSIRNYFENRGDLDMKRRVLESIRGSSVIQECYDVAAGYCVNACQKLCLLPDSLSYQALTDIADFIVKRNN